MRRRRRRKGTFPWSSFVFLRLDGRKASGDEQTAAFRYIVGKEGGGPKIALKSIAQEVTKNVVQCNLS